MPTLSELLSRLRSDLDDVEQPQFWGDAQLIDFINEAEAEACKRARLIVDSDSDMCTLRLRSGNARYDVDDRIMWVQRAIIEGEDYPLDIKGAQDMDELCPGWESQTGTPRYLIPNMRGEGILLSPTPTQTHTLKMTVERYPLTKLTDDEPDNTPEIKPEHHVSMLDWSRSLAYSVQDGEMYDPDAAARAAASFASRFGPLREVRSEEYMRIKRPQISNPEFF